MSQEDSEISEVFDSDGEDNELHSVAAYTEEGSEKQAKRFALIRFVRTSSGADHFVQSVAQQTILSSNCDWGALLNCAPRALCSMGQCFVVASSPLAAALELPSSAGLQFKSLRANLVQCSDLGRVSFREAESKMGKVSMTAQNICEPGGTIDKILEAVDDEDLAEFELPRQLQKLKRVSESCVNDTKEVKETVKAWKDYVIKIRLACEDEGQIRHKIEQTLEEGIHVKSEVKDVAEKEVKETQLQTAEWRNQLSTHQAEFLEAKGSLRRGPLTDLATSAGEALINAVHSMYNPLHFLSYLGSGSKSSSNAAEVNVETEDDNGHAFDRGYKLAENVQKHLQLFEILMNTGADDHFHGMDWQTLSGYSEDGKDKSASVIVGYLKDQLQRFADSQTVVTQAAQANIYPVLKIGELLVKIAEQQRSQITTGSAFLEEEVKKWKDQAKKSKHSNEEIIAEKKRLKKEREERRPKRSKKSENKNMSRSQIRFERYQASQLALLETEDRLSQKMENERKARKEFEEVQLELSRLGSEKITVTKVKRILQRCVKNLEQYYEQVDELSKYFTQVQQFIESINADRVDEVIGRAETTRKVINKASLEDREAKKQKHMDTLRLDALKLRGYYLVAQTMADTYVDVSSKYIIPGLNMVDRLGIGSDHEVSESALQKKIQSLQKFADGAQAEISKLALERKNRLLDELLIRREEVEEVDFAQLHIEEH